METLETAVAPDEVLARADAHVAAGRIPVLSAAIRNRLLELGQRDRESRAGRFLARLGPSRGHRLWLTRK
jgi:hypothetical protein